MNKLKNIFKRLKKIWELPEKQEYYLNHTFSEIDRLERKIGERTTIHADIGYKGTGCQIIVVGRYRNKDYVRSFNVRMDSLPQLIELLSQEERGANVGKFDMIGGIEFSSVYCNDIFE